MNTWGEAFQSDGTAVQRLLTEFRSLKEMQEGPAAKEAQKEAKSRK